MLILICLVLLLVGYFTVQLFSDRERVNLLKKIPGPPTLPIVGCALLFNDTYEGVWKMMRKLMDEYYPTMCLWLLSTPVVFIRHPDDLQTLLKSKTNINKSDFFYKVVVKYGNDGIIFSGGTKWHERRKLMNQAFLRNSLKAVIESANKYADLFVRKIQHTDDKSIHNVMPLALKFSLAVICNASMGYDLHTVGAPYEAQYRKALDNLLEIVFYLVSRPYIKDWMLKILLIERELQRNRKILTDFSIRVIEERLNYHKINGINILSDDFFKSDDSDDSEGTSLHDYNFLDMLCIYKSKGLIDDQGMFEELEMLVAAAYETTGLTISYMLLLFAENPQEQDLARQEIIEVMDNCDKKLTLAEIQKMQYLNRCLKETLRILPPVPLIGRKLVKDTQFRDYLVPKDVDIIGNIFDLHRDPKYWPEPTKFNPDRFLPESIKYQHPYAFIPFSSGLRNCIGQRHGTAEVKIMIAHILYNFYVEPVEDTRNIKIDFNVLLKPTSGQLRVKLTKISKY